VTRLLGAACGGGAPVVAPIMKQKFPAVVIAAFSSSARAWA
jgi:hypothetical protein